MQAFERERSPLAQMRRGVVEHCVLALLGRGEWYAVELVQELNEHGLIISEGTVYPLLSRLRKHGLVRTTWRESESGPPRRYYRLDEQGAAAVARFTEDWASLSKSVERIIRGKDNRT